MIARTRTNCGKIIAPKIFHIAEINFDSTCISLGLPNKMWTVIDKENQLTKKEKQVSLLINQVQTIFKQVQTILGLILVYYHKRLHYNTKVVSWCRFQQWRPWRCCPCQLLGTDNNVAGAVTPTDRVLAWREAEHLHQSSSLVQVVATARELHRLNPPHGRFLTLSHANFCAQSR